MRILCGLAGAIANDVAGFGLGRAPANDGLAVSLEYGLVHGVQHALSNGGKGDSDGVVGRRAGAGAGAGGPAVVTITSVWRQRS